VIRFLEISALWLPIDQGARLGLSLIPFAVAWTLLAVWISVLLPALLIGLSGVLDRALLSGYLVLPELGPFSTNRAAGAVQKADANSGAAWGPSDPCAWGGVSMPAVQRS